MIFQDPLSSLNPTFTVWGAVADAVLAHPSAQRAGRGDVRRRAGARHSRMSASRMRMIASTTIRISSRVACGNGS